MGKSSPERFQITLAQTPQRSFQGAAVGTHATPAPNRAHSGLHSETRGVLDGGAITTLGAFCAVRKPCAAGCQNGFAAFGSWSGVLPKSAESLRDSDTLMRVAVPRRRGPAGLRDPVAVSLAALMGFTVLLSRFVGTQKIERLFFSYSGAFFER